MFIRIIRGRATNPPGIRRDLGRWQRLLAADAADSTGPADILAAAGIGEDPAPSSR